MLGESSAKQRMVLVGGTGSQSPARRLWASKVIQTNWRTYQAWKAWRETDPLTYLLRWKACIEISRRWRGHVARWRCRYLRAKRLWEPWLRRGGLLPPRGSIEKAKLKVRKQIRLSWPTGGRA